MSTGERRPLAAARREAEEFRAMFAGLVEVWEIAGSVRREKPEVGDVEHVVMPRMSLHGGLFSQATGGVSNLLWQGVDRRVQSGDITKAVYPDGKHRWGDRHRGVMFRGFRHEIFTADPDNWGAILAIRTGPAELSQALVTRMRDGVGGPYRQHLGYVRRGTAEGGEVVVPVPTEESFFKLCRTPMRAPRDRVPPF